MKFRAKITGVGDEAFAFLEEALDLNFVIIFNDNAPEELADLAILHEISTLQSVPEPSDIVKLGKKLFKVSAVGHEVPHTLATLGHCTMAFGGGEAYRPGCLMLEGDPISAEDIVIGDTIEIY